MPTCTVCVCRGAGVFLQLWWITLSSSSASSPTATGGGDVLKPLGDPCYQPSPLPRCQNVWTLHLICLFTTAVLQWCKYFLFYHCRKLTKTTQNPVSFMSKLKLLYIKFEALTYLYSVVGLSRASHLYYLIKNNILSSHTVKIKDERMAHLNSSLYQDKIFNPGHKKCYFPAGGW